MAKRILVLFILIFSISSYASDIIIISDFDDTIKRTHVDNVPRAVVNSLFTQKIFKGMDDLFGVMATYSQDLYILSNSPHVLRFNIFKLLEKHSIHPKEVSTRHLLEDHDGFIYKYNYIVKKITHLNSQAILLGDDVGEDPEVFSMVQKNYPEKVLAIYIHIVKNRKIPDNVIPYITSFDIALNEFSANRMNFHQAYLLSESVIFNDDLKKVIPPYSYCPQENSLWNRYEDHELGDLIKKVVNKITLFCKK